MFHTSSKTCSIQDATPCDRGIPPLKEKGGNVQSEVEITRVYFGREEQAGSHLMSADAITNCNGFTASLAVCICIR